MNDIQTDPQVERILGEQDAYRDAPPAALPRMMRGFSKPIGLLTHRLIPSEAIEIAIRGADWAASSSIRKAAIAHDFSNLEDCEEAVAEVRRWALGYAVTGGGAAGAFGAFGLALDVPATIALALRTVRLTGLCYGFGDDSEVERVYILDVLNLAGANSTEEKAEALKRLEKDRSEIDPDSWQKIVKLTGQTSGTLAATRRVATTLGVNLSTRKMAQVTPIIGAAVGAGVNATFQNDVAVAARYAYRSRWLLLNAGIIEGRSEVLEAKGR